MPTILLSKSWYCPTCNYVLPVAIDPFGTYFTTQMTIRCGGIDVVGIPAGMCPSCYAHPDPAQRVQVAMVQGDASTPNSNLVKTTTLQSADLDAMMMPEFNSDGTAVMVDSGKVSYHLDPITGSVVSAPVMVQQMRALTATEKQTMLDQANQTLTALNPITVKQL